MLPDTIKIVLQAIFQVSKNCSIKTMLNKKLFYNSKYSLNEHYSWSFAKPNKVMSSKLRVLKIRFTNCEYRFKNPYLNAISVLF